MDGRTSVNISRTKRTAEAVSGSDYCAQASPLSGPFTHPLTAEFRSLIGGALRFHGSAIAPLNSCYQHGGENVNEVKGESALEAWKKANGFRKPSQIRRKLGRTNLISSLLPLPALTSLRNNNNNNIVEATSNVSIRRHQFRHCGSEVRCAVLFATSIR